MQDGHSAFRLLNPGATILGQFVGHRRTSVRATVVAGGLPVVSSDVQLPEPKTTSAVSE